MKFLVALLTGLLFVNTSADLPADQKNQRLYVAHYEQVLGTSMTVKFISSSSAEAAKAEHAVLNEIDRLASIFSAYEEKSEFSIWMKQDLNKPTKVSKELFGMLSLFVDWKNRTNGALDPSAAVAIKMWNDAGKHKKKPTKLAIKQAVDEMSRTHYQLDPVNLTATRLTHAQLLMNTFTKSYIIDAACDAALSASTVSSVVVNIGGDLVVKGAASDLVNITDPKANGENDLPLTSLSISNRAVATSGNYRRGVQVGGKWFSHIIDPRTALPVEGVISATVIAPNAVDAGALATAFNILPLKESMKLAATVPEAAYLIITSNGKKIESKGFNALIDPTTNESTEESHQPMLKGAEKSWDPKFELSVNFEFNAIAGNSHRPFAAIWVEDANRVAVRNLVLWYNKPKWIPDLRNWYRINGESFKADKTAYASATGATRNPGKYTIKWDGKNDKGLYVPQGKYTIIIETSKEHGTDEILRQEMELKKTPKKVNSTGNVEISNVVFEFRKK